MKKLRTSNFFQSAKIRGAICSQSIVISNLGRENNILGAIFANRLLQMKYTMFGDA